MRLYVAIDLHSNNCVLLVMNEQGQVMFSKRLPNVLTSIIEALRSCLGTVVGVAVESTYNWYWLVDGLLEAGFPVRLVHTAAVKQYEGKKHGDDFSDAHHLADLMRMDKLHTGYIYPKETRALRDLGRKRSQLVQQRTSQVLSLHNLMARNLGANAGGNDIKAWTVEYIDALPLLPEQKTAMKANLAVMRCLDEQVSAVERAILSTMRKRDDFKALKTVSGIGEVLALTIALEVGDIGRFDSPGNFASYARLVDSRRESNGKKKGEGNTKCGNRYLAWAFIEAAHFAVRYDAVIKRWYQRKCAKSKTVVAIKAVAHKLARACFHIMKDGTPFDAARAFS